MNTPSEAKLARLRALSTKNEIIAAMAIDQRGSLRQMMLDAGDAATDAQIAEFKSAVVAALTPHASAVLIDPEIGLPAAASRAPGCGLLLAYEMDGYNNPRPHRMLALIDGLSARRLRGLGADGIKILLHYAPDADAAANDQKLSMIERIGQECDAAGVPFFLEPVGYDPGGLNPNGFAFAKRKPEIVLHMMEEFSKEIYKVDILKVEFPVNVSFVDGAEPAYTRAQALDYYRRADALAKRPYIYLSAGVRGEQFLASLDLAREAGVRYSGVLCGRATWQDGVAAYVRGGLAGLQSWLEIEGVRNIKAVNEAIRSATPWSYSFQPTAA
jgi:tagatose 1,6-diphosphate aldolase